MTGQTIVVCEGPACLERGAADLWAGVHLLVADRGLGGELKVRRSGCRAHCQDAIVAGLFPDRVSLTRLAPDDAPLVVQRALTNETNRTPLRRVRRAESPPRRSAWGSWGRWR